MPTIADIISREEDRQGTVLEMIPSENYASRAVIEAVGSALTNKYAEGYPGARYYQGNDIVDEAENLARDRATALFGFDHANVQAHSGTQANMAVYLGVMKPGDTVLGPPARRRRAPDARSQGQREWEALQLRRPTASTARPRSIDYDGMLANWRRSTGRR